MFGLSPSTIQALCEVFQRYPQVERVVLYGSRARGNYRPGSDIDLVMEGRELNLTELQRIECELDDLLLPYKIDLSVLHHIQNPELLAQIQAVGSVFYEKPEVA